MTNLLREISDWIIGFVDSEWAIAVLAINSFVESIFFPIPPDPMLIGIAIRHPDMALWLATIVTLTSTAGGIISYWLGQQLGRPVLDKFVSTNRIARVEQMVDKYGLWIIIVAAFTPLPHKLFAISAGILKLNLYQFIVASLIGRGARFFLIGALIFVFGEPIVKFINQHFLTLTIGLAFALICTVSIVAIITKRHRS